MVKTWYVNIVFIVIKLITATPSYIPAYSLRTAMTMTISKALNGSSF